VPEWGLITGYDDDRQMFATLAVNGEGEMAYNVLGKRELPIMSVLTITGASDKSKADILRDTMKLAGIYKSVYEAWQEAFKIKKEQDASQPEVKGKIAALLKSAHENEIKAVGIME
jgi:hypothetical protein